MKNTQQLKKELEKKDKEIKELKKLLRESVKWGREAEELTGFYKDLASQFQKELRNK